MTADVLSGRELEIAVAKALSWTADGDDSDRGLWRLYQHSGRIPGPYWWPSAEEAWQKDSPHYLTDPVAFASVLVAITATQTKWTHGSTRSGHGFATIFPDTSATGDTYQEATLRAFVAWKAE